MKPCPICGAATAPRFLEKYDSYEINRCPSCNVIYSDPMRNPGASWYRNSEMYAVGKMSPGVLGWHHDQFLKDENFYGKKLLDVGCGSGFFLSHAHKKGYDISGIDFDEDDIRIARERYGIKSVYLKSVEDIYKDPSIEKFDVVTLFEVLEHLDDPARFMRQVRHILKKGGYIALSVPNRDRKLDFLGEGDYPPNHLTKWNKDCLSSFLENNGFEVIRCSVKKVDSNELACYLMSKIRFGISKRVARRGIDSNNTGDIQKAAGMMSKKVRIFNAATVLFSPLLRILQIDGTGLYALARLR